MANTNETPNYIACKSAFKGIITIVFSVIFYIVAIVSYTDIAVFAFDLIIAVVVTILGIIRIIRAKCSKIIFYENRVVERSGLIAKHEKSSLLTGIVGVSIKQGVFGRVFHYGDVIIDKVGKGWDIKTKNIANPDGLKSYMEQLISQTAADGKINSFIIN